MGASKPICIVVLLGRVIWAQVPAAATPQKIVNLGEDLAGEILQADGAIRDSSISTYVQNVADKVGSPESLHVGVRVTKALADYAILLPGPLALLSSGLILRTDSEAEFAAILAHIEAHAPSLRMLNVSQPESTIIRVGNCALAIRILGAGMGANGADVEDRANAQAVHLLRSALYDPMSLVSIFSKLRYQHPEWENAFLYKNLEKLRTALDAEALPAGGYVFDSSKFAAVRARLNNIVDLKLRPASAISQRRP